MPTIKQKTQRRCRIQITVNRDLHMQYLAVKEHAKNLHADIDFSEDFEPWLLSQIEIAELELKKLEEKLATSD